MQINELVSYLWCSRHEILWYRNLIKLSINNTLIFPTQLHPHHTEVGSSKIQGIEQPFLIPYIPQHNTIQHNTHQIINNNTSNLNISLAQS